MFGFETYDSTGKVTFSTNDSTYLVVRTIIIPGKDVTVSNGQHFYAVRMPVGFTEILPTLYPVEVLDPATGAVMPTLKTTIYNTVTPPAATLEVTQPAESICPTCMLVVLGR